MDSHPLFINICKYTKSILNAQVFLIYFLFTWLSGVSRERKSRTFKGCSTLIPEVLVWYTHSLQCEPLFHLHISLCLYSPECSAILLVFKRFSPTSHIYIATDNQQWDRFIDSAITTWLYINSIFLRLVWGLHSFHAVSWEVFTSFHEFGLWPSIMTVYFNSITHFSNQVLRNFYFYFFFKQKYLYLILQI